MKRVGSVYYISWYQDNKNEDFRNRAIELFNRALRILADFPENKIDEMAILKNLALLEKDNEKQIEIIKRINVDEIYSTGDLGFTKKELQAIKRVQEHIENHI